MFLIAITFISGFDEWRNLLLSNNWYWDILGMTNKLRIKHNKINIISKSLKQVSVQNFPESLKRFKGSNTEIIKNKTCTVKIFLSYLPVTA